MNGSFDYSTDSNTEDVIFGSGFSMTSKQLRSHFPYHIAFNHDFNIIQMGGQISSMIKTKTNIKNISFEHIGKFFRLYNPLNNQQIIWDWKKLLSVKTITIELELLEDYLSPDSHFMVRNQPMVFVGSVILMDPKDDLDLLARYGLLILNPKISSTVELLDWEMKLSDLPPHSYQSQYIAMAERYRLITEELIRLEKRNHELEETNTNLINENNSQDTRHMIANVAHDLKTPLTAFLSGVEVIRQASDEIRNALNADPYNNCAPSQSFNLSTYTQKMSTKANENINVITNNIQNMLDINNFMTMTINRCIDYTKASQGLKLTPKYDTVDLAESVLLPLNCMHSLQTKVNIRLLPISNDFCPYIITDKQWLQENILCLLSNAVKYSHEGEVTVRMFLHPSNDGLATNKQQQLLHQPPSTKNRTSFTSTNANTNKESPTSNSAKIHHCDSMMDDESCILEDSYSPTVGIASPSSSKRFEESLRLDRGVTNHTNSTDLMGPAAIFNLSSNSSNKSFSSKSTMQDKLGSRSMLVIDIPDNSARSSNTPFLVIEIEDTGIGLSEEAMENLFNPFKQAQRLAGGTGLGLYSLAKRMEALSGSFGVERRRDGGRGSLFWFAIPFRPDKEYMKNKKRKNLLDLHIVNFDQAIRNSHEEPAAVTDIRISPKPDNHDDEHGVKGLNILVVDDSAPILKMTVLMLKRNGHNVEQAVNGAEAVDKIAQRRAQKKLYDVVLMDLIMPVMDGLEAARRIRKNEGADVNDPSKQLIIGVSANGDEDTIIEALSAGMDEFMCKPFTLNTFNETYIKATKG